MTIRLNEALTSLCDVDCDEEINQVIQMECGSGNQVRKKSTNKKKTQKMKFVWMVELP
jgi:hypothetical protein